MRLSLNQNFAMRRRSRTRGFTLIEAALTSVIVGVGFLATLQLLASGTISNIKGIEGTTGINLAKNVREWYLTKTWAQLTALQGANPNYAPPIDSRGIPLSSFSDWQQGVVVQSVDPDRLTFDIASASPSALRITVTVSHNGHQACVLTWFIYQNGP